MNYQSIYDQLISKRKNKTFNGYGEKHHIIPKSLGGSDHKSNIVKLTAREHFIAHRLLAKIHGGKMWCALFLMSHQNIKSAKGLKISSRVYQVIKKNNAKVKSDHMKGEGNHFYGIKHSEETIKKISKRKYYKGKEHHYCGKNRSPDDLWVSMMVRKYTHYDFVIDYSLMDRIHKSIGYIETRRKKTGLHGKSYGVARGKSKELKQLSCYYASMIANTKVNDAD